MHQVRVHMNSGEGTLWWAEDDRGFTGGADTLAELIASIYEWADSEGTRDDLKFVLVGDPVSPHLDVESSPSVRPTSAGTRAVNVGSVLVSA